MKTETIAITKETIAAIITKLYDRIEDEKDFEVVIRKRDNSVQARQRGLAYIWYKEIAKHNGWSVNYAEAWCKYYHGLRLAVQADPMLREIVKRMLGPYAEMDRIIIIEEHPSWFPILRDKGGLGVEDTCEYLTEMQNEWREKGLYLYSNKDDDLLNYPEAQKAGRPHHPVDESRQAPPATQTDPGS